MPINICDTCGRVTGFRNCPWHQGGRATTRQYPPFTEREVKPVLVAQAKPQRSIAACIARPFKLWRQRHREKAVDQAIARDLAQQDWQTFSLTWKG